MRTTKQEVKVIENLEYTNVKHYDSEELRTLKYLAKNISYSKADRPSICGVYIDRANGRIIATDSYRLAIIKNQSESNDQDSSFFFPKRVIDNVAEHLTVYTKEDIVKVTFIKKLKNGNVIDTQERVDFWAKDAYQFPFKQIDNVFEKDNEYKKFIYNVKDLKALIKTIENTSKEELGEYKAYRYMGIAVNYKYLISLLKLTLKYNNGEVTISYKNEYDPIYIESDGFDGLLMPIRD